MTIGIFTDTYHPQISGVDTSIKVLCRGLAALGHRTIIFTTTDPGAREPETDVYRLPSVPLFFLPTRRVAFAVPPRLLAKIKSLELDVVHTHTEFSMGYFGKIAAGVLGLPIAHTYHTMYEDYTHYLARGRLITPAGARRFSRNFCNGATVVTTPTEKMRELLLQYGVRKPIHTIPTGIEFDKFNPYPEAELLAARAELGLSGDDPVLVTVGRVAKEKGMDTVIRALPLILAKIPNVKYVSVGDGPYTAELEILAHSLGVGASVIFAGPRCWSVIGKYYQIGDIFVSASTSETQGIVYIEAMASKVPLIVKRDKSVDDILLDGRTGLFFDNPEELANHAISLLKNPDRRRTLAANAHAHIRPLSADIFASNMEALYKDLLDNNPRAKKRITLRVRR